MHFSACLPKPIWKPLQADHRLNMSKYVPRFPEDFNQGTETGKKKLSWSTADRNQPGFLSSSPAPWIYPSWGCRGCGGSYFIELTALSKRLT